ncbi:hypothetical protein, partial [Trinickia sp.]|uniref:hypothetical protein n=1 Tax=Trinickia sp. TaxID=2571163 RepID=UPI003F7F5C2C
MMAIVAFCYLAWQLVGIRYENHDDIYFHIFAWLSSGDYLGFASRVARFQARGQAFINMPLILWADKLSDSAWYDVVNLSSFALVYASLIVFLRRIGSISAALGLASATLLLFPLHYFFTFPQGYPLIYSWGLAAGLLSPALLASHIDNPSPYKRWISVALFLCSLWGPEYNFVLHAALLVVIVVHRGVRSFRAMWTRAWPYAIGSILTFGVYLAYSLSARTAGGNGDSRVSVGLHPLTWLETMLTLQGKAFLPSALAIGLNLSSAPAQGTPTVDSPLTYAGLWHSAHDHLSLVAVFLAASWAFFVLLKRQATTPKACVYYAAASLLIAAIPAGIVSISSLYQTNVLKGYLQGHLVTFYSQLGLSGVLFSLCMLACAATPDRLRSAIRATCVILLASAATLTFAYNNLNRQLMMANAQKWAAMSELVDFAYSSGANLTGKTIAAPAFWTSAGVSNITAADALQV